MKYGRIPHLDLDLPRIVCGTDWLLGAAPEESFPALDAYWEAGGNVFDTANIYGANTNILAAWVEDRGHADEIVYFDKVGHPRWRNGAKESTIRREAIREELARNFRRLNIVRNDLLVLHRDDPEVPVGEIVDWLNELVAEDKIRAFGGSNWTHERIAAANEYAHASGKQGFSLNNPNLTLAENTKPLWDDCLTIGNEGRAWHEATGLPLFSWSSTARGYFARPDDAHVNASYDNETSRARRDRADEVAKTYGTSAVGIALAWVLNQPFPTFALCGLRTPEQVRENIAAGEIELTPEEVRYLEDGN